MRIHVCLVSKQPLPNLLPALDPATKPDQVLLIVSQAMKAQAEALQTVLRERQIKIFNTVHLDDERDFFRTSEQLMDAAQALVGHDVQLNTTGGTKLMAAAAQAVAQACDWKMFYVDFDSSELVWLDQKQPHPSHSLSEEIRLNQYLQSHGLTRDRNVGTQKPQPTREENQLLEYLVSNVNSLQPAIGQLNALAQQARANLKTPLGQDVTEQTLRLLNECQATGFIDLSEPGMIKFKSQDKLDFLAGGWLELHTFNVLNRYHGQLGIRDKALNLELLSADGTRNEMDVLLLARNRLFLIECKTAKMDQNKANDTLYKISANRDRLGLGTKALLVSYRSLQDAEKKLAKTLRIEVIAGSAIQQLGSKLEQWILGTAPR